MREGGERSDHVVPVLGHVDIDGIASVAAPAIVLKFGP